MIAWRQYSAPLAVLFLVFVPTGAATSAASLHARERTIVRDVESAKQTLRFFESHASIMYAPATKARAWHVVALARQRVIRGRVRLERIRVELRRLARPVIPHRAEWLCIYSHENGGYGWSAITGNGYYGGLQMDLSFQRTYGPEFYARKGTADHWTPDEQMVAAERAWRTRGFHPWPNTARMCGLL